MKKTVTTLLAVLFATALAAQDIDLPAPHRTGGMPLMEALANRHSSRDFDSRELPKQTLSNLLWAAWGYNRADKRTAPSSRDKQEIELYVAMKGGLYRYDAAKTPDELIAATYANTGFIAQNVYLFCASESLATVVRAMVDRDKLAAAMALPDDSMITLVQTVGYPAAK